MWPLGRGYGYRRGDLRCRRFRRLVLFEWHKCDFVKIVVTGCTRSSHFDNSWSSQWQKVHKCYHIFISVKLNVKFVIYENYEDILQCCLSHCPLGERKFWWVIFKLIFLQIDDRSFSSEIDLWWMSLNPTDDKSPLVQEMSWCRKATNHYLSQFWPRFCHHMVSLDLNEFIFEHHQLALYATFHTVYYLEPFNDNNEHW